MRRGRVTEAPHSDVRGAVELRLPWGRAVAGWLGSDLAGWLLGWLLACLVVGWLGVMLVGWLAGGLVGRRAWSCACPRAGDWVVVGRSSG